MRCYFTPVTGDGQTPATAVWPAGVARRALRQVELASATRAFVVALPSAAEHDAALAAGVTYLPLEDANGNPLPLSAPASDIPVAQRDQLRARLEAEGVSVSDLVPAGATVRAVLRRVLRRLRLRDAMGADDFVEPLDAKVRDLPLARRQAIRARLEARGFDPSVVQLTDTIREAQRKLLAQNLSALVTTLD